MSRLAAALAGAVVTLAIVWSGGPAGALAEPPPSAPPSPVLDGRLLLTNGNIITMDPATPHAEAILITGDAITAVGSDADLRAMMKPIERVVDLRGRTVLPGFIDSHTHRLTQRHKWGLDSIGDAAVLALSQGWTGLQELAVSPGELDDLIAADARDELRVRLDVYLTVNGFDGSPLDDWFTAYRPGQEISPHLRVAGLKIFIDFDSGRTLLWEPDALDDYVRRRHREGWQVSMKAIGQRSHELALDAIEFALDGAPNASHRHRLEHSIAVSDEQLARMARLGVIAAIQPSFPGVIWYQEDIRRLVADEGRDNTFRWPEYLAAGVIAAASPLNPDPGQPELTAPSHVSAVGLIHRTVTQLGLGESRPEPWMLTRALTVERLLPLMTIDGAYAANVEQVRGSLEVGKLADLVILSADPSVVVADDLLSIEVLATMVGGVAEYLGPGAADLAELPTGPAVRAAEQPPVVDEPPAVDIVDAATDARIRASSSLPSNPASLAVDGTPEHWNAAGLPRQWIELELRRPIELVEIRLEVAQDPPGRTVHKVFVRGAGGRLERVATFSGVTADGDVLNWAPREPMPAVDLVRIVTTRTPDLFPAWREIGILGRHVP